MRAINEHLHERLVRQYFKGNRYLNIMEVIRACTRDDLLRPEFIEALMGRLGFNNEMPSEQPKFVRENTGGLRIWQYPNQFSKYLIFLSGLGATSYLEIGCRWGWTFILTCEYLKKFGPFTKSLAVDPIDSPVAAYCRENPESNFMQAYSTSREFIKHIDKEFYDVIFIDGDHSYDGVALDYHTCKSHGRVFVFHDIVNDACPGVSRFWNELKADESSEYTFHEFTDQYPDVAGSFLGIGVAVKV
jgi:cephalosporin hydroxylase